MRRTGAPPSLPHFGWQALTLSSDDRSPNSCPPPTPGGMGGEPRGTTISHWIATLPPTKGNGGG
eukprot:3279873-Alexandrium_andersonii.AAC.1